VLFQELLVQADSREHLLGRIFRNIARFFVLSGLLKVRTLGWALQGNLALLSAALRADATVHSQAKTLFLSQIADRTGQEEPPAAGYCGLGTHLLWHLPARGIAKTRMDVAFSSAPVEKTA
jgi:hypothetical protein